ncbi:hypothetical protein [Phenylobacterium sp.]|jgi:hypothetical protein|uniref:hypothetical protein n=1 Tax=Phenylobacterium sp. TaxID=1871053 RepID=UPI002F9584C3
MSPPPFIFLATPCHGGQVAIHYLRSTLGLQGACRARGVGLHVELLDNDPLVVRARSRLAARFLAHPHATHLLFCDADIGFGPENAFRLLDSGKDVAAAVCPVKHIDWEKVRAAAQGGAADLMAAGLGYVVGFLPTRDNSVEIEDGLAKVAYGGTGFLMIRREALERVVEAHPELMTHIGDVEPATPTVPMVFETMVEPETGRYLSEDYAFCRRWRDLGGEIWADVEARLTHVGLAAYEGQLKARLRPA